MQYANKLTLAEYLDVSERSIDRYQTLGMPHKKSGNNRYPVGYCIHWYVGFHESKPYEFKVTNSLVITLFGYAIAGLDRNQLRKKAHEISQIMNFSEEDCGESVGILIQANLVS